MFTINVRKSVANGVQDADRVARSLDDECLDVATSRRIRYASVLNLDELLAEEASTDRASFELRISKSLTTLVTSDSNDTSDTNDRDSIANELSLAEKSMRMLSITAEDVMDARARIQERAYWAEQEAAVAKTPESAEEMVAQFSLEKDVEGTYDATRNGQTTTNDVEAIVDSASRPIDIAGYPRLEKREKVERDDEIVILTEKWEEAVDFSEIKNGGTESAELKDRVKATGSREYHVASKKEDEKEEARIATKIVQCPSSESARNAEEKPCSILLRKMIAGLRSARASRLDKSSLDVEIDSGKYPGRVETRLIAIASKDSLEEKRPMETSSDTCCCTSRVYINARAADAKDIRDVKRDGEFGSCEPNRAVTRRGKPDEVDEFVVALGHSEHHLRGQAWRSRGSIGAEQSAWDSISLARIARPSGYEVRREETMVASDGPSTCQMDVPPVIFNEPKDLARKRVSRHVQRMQHGRSYDPRSIYDAMSRKEKNYMDSEECDVVRGRRALRTYNDLDSPEDKREMKDRKKHDLPSTRKPSIEKRETLDSKALRAYNELILLKDRDQLEARRRRDASSSNHDRQSQASVASRAKLSKTYNDLTSPEDERTAETVTRCADSLSNREERSIASLEIPTTYEEPVFPRNKEAGRKDESPKRAALSVLEEAAVASSDRPPGTDRRHEEITIDPSTTRPDADSDAVPNDQDERRTRVSLNLHEITRSIEWTLHPRGIVLTNKNLHGELSHGGRGRESRQRDIVDDNVAGTLHSAFYFKPAIVATILRRAQATRIADGESLAQLSTYRREPDPDAFVCRVSNDRTSARDTRGWSLIDLERGIAAPGAPLFADISATYDEDRAIAGEEDGRYLRIIFGEQEETASESRSAILEDDASSSFEDVDTSGVLTLDGDGQDDAANDDELSVRFIIDVLRNFSVVVSTTSARDVLIERIDEYGDLSNAMTNNEFSINVFDASDVNMDEGSNNTSNNCSDNVDVPSSVDSTRPGNLCDSHDEKYLDATDTNLEDKEVHKCKFSREIADDDAMTSRSSSFGNNTANRQLNNKIGKSIFNRALESPSKISFPGPSSFVESSMLRSSDEKLEKLTQFSDSQIISENGRKKSVSNLRIENSGNISRFSNAEISGMEDAAQDSARSDYEDEDIYGGTNEFSADRLFRMNSGFEMSQRHDSFDSTYERHGGGAETPISLQEGSLMEEFSDDIASPRTSSDVSVRDSVHSQ